MLTLSGLQGDCTQRNKASVTFTHRRSLLVLEQGVAFTLRLRCEGVEAIQLTCTDPKTYSSWCVLPYVCAACSHGCFAFAVLLVFSFIRCTYGLLQRRLIRIKNSYSISIIIIFS